jgi:hypothetical protein
MKRYTIIVLVFVFSGSLYAQEFTNARQEILEFAKAYSPTATSILTQVDFDFEKYVTENNYENLLENFNTLVHESAHVYNHQNSVNFCDSVENEKACEGYFLNSKAVLLVAASEVYNSNKLNKFVPDTLKKQIMRYNEYIGKKQVLLSAQKEGVLGLIEEFNAYYLGTKACFELYDYYRKNHDPEYKNHGVWIKYVQNIGKTHHAYYEFKLFISWYLQYAKEKYPEIYEGLMNDKRLRVVYTLIDNEFGQLQKDYYVMLDQLQIEQNKKEIGLKLAKSSLSNKTYLYVYENGKKKAGEGIYEDKVEMLSKLLQGEEHKILETFRVEGVTLSNYKEHTEKE